MPDLCWIIGVLCFAYGAATTGLGVALASRTWLRRRGGRLSSAEAVSCALSPLLAILVLPVVLVLQPALVGCLPTVHHLWHRWQHDLYEVPVAHGLIHVANFLLLAFAVFRVARFVYVLARLRVFAGRLRAAASADHSDVDGVRLHLLVSPRPACFTWGLFRPAIYLSTALQEHLSPRDREAVLAHETAHAQRRDGLVSTLVMAFYTLFPLPGGQMLRTDWERAVERDCDTAAAHRIGSPCDVAAALLRVARCTRDSSYGVPGAACFTAASEDIEGRIQALLDLPSSGIAQRANGRVLPWLLLASLAAIIVTDSWLPHAVELFIRH
jgi:beta-lactamase regulating signal transducer with metallopeptidase domain